MSVVKYDQRSQLGNAIARFHFKFLNYVEWPIWRSCYCWQFFNSWWEQRSRNLIYCEFHFTCFDIEVVHIFNANAQGRSFSIASGDNGHVLRRMTRGPEVLPPRPGRRGLAALIPAIECVFPPGRGIPKSLGTHPSGECDRSMLRAHRPVTSHNPQAPPRHLDTMANRCGSRVSLTVRY